jgi:hypothetical protein
MASATSKDSTPAPYQKAPPAPETIPTGTKPVLAADLDPVLLLRLYPGAIDLAAARRLALAAGQAAYEAGPKVMPSQQEPVG